MTQRRVACDILLRVEKGGYSNLLLSTRDTTAFITALVYGVLERRITIDEMLTPLLKGGVKKLDIEVATILRMSAYQLLFMDSIPDYAAISEGVGLCKIYKKTSAGGLVNAVLRKIKNSEIPNTETAKYSLHRDIIDKLKADYPNDYKKIAENSLQRPETCIYANLNKTSINELCELLKGEGVKTTKGIADNTLFCEGEPPVQTEAFKQGLFHVIGSCSALTAQGVLSFKPETILDLCAAPGGKTAIMAMSAKKVVACDVSKNRVSALQKQLSTLFITNVECIINDAAKDLPNGEFDAVLCDVPCSGSGVISRKPEMRLSAPNIKTLCEVQQKILQNAAGALKAGGVLCYSTCSLYREENEQQISRFLEVNKNFERLELPFDSPNFCECRDKSITFFPDNKKFDGFFVAFLRKVW